LTFILHEYPIIQAMKTILIDLLNIINLHINYIEEEYPKIKGIILQINELLEYNATDTQIVNWMILNSDIIKVVNECVENKTNSSSDL